MKTLAPNPFAVHTPEALSVEDIDSLFVNVFSDFYQIPKEGHTFLNGPRGSGKSMMFRYMQPDCQLVRAAKENAQLQYFGVYVPIKRTNLNVTELGWMKNNYSSLILNEHLLTLTLLKYTLLNVQTYSKQTATCGDEVQLYHRFQQMLVDSGYGKKETTYERIDQLSVLTHLRCQCDEIYAQALDYLRRLPFGTIGEGYNGCLLGYLDFMMPLVQSLRELKWIPDIPVYFLIDDADFLNLDQTRILNSWVSTRTTDIASLKISTQLRYKTRLTPTGSRIETPHDYLDVNVATVYTSSKNRYLERIADIVSKRLAASGINPDPRAFFPPDIAQEMQIKEFEKRHLEKPEIRGARPRDDSYRYARPDYMKSLRGIHKSGSTYSYAGFEQLVHLSSGIIRYFLESAFEMYAKVEATQPLNIPSISPAIQNEVARADASSFLHREFDKMKQDEVSLDPQAGEKFTKLFNLVTVLGGMFQIILYSDRSERRVFSFALSNEIDPSVADILHLGLVNGYFHESSIGTKEGFGRTRLYVLSRRLAPFFELDPTSFAGYKFVTSQFLLAAINDPKRTLGRLKSGSINLNDDQVQLFGTEEDAG